MPPRPFLFPFRMGIDICKIDRIKGIVQPKTLKKSLASQFFHKLLTQREFEYFKRRFIGPHMHGEGERTKIANFLAGRWAAKEACVKAVKPRKLTHHDIEIWPDYSKEIYGIILDEPSPTTTTTSSTNTKRKHRQNEDYSTSVTADSSYAENIEEVEEDLETRFKEKRDPHVDPMAIVPSHEEIEGQIVRVSLSHDSDYACAVAVWMGDGKEMEGAMGIVTGGEIAEGKLTSIERELASLKEVQAEQGNVGKTEKTP